MIQNVSIPRDEPAAAPTGLPNATLIERWLVRSLEEALELDPGELDVNVPFDEYGLDSTEAVGLVSALEDWLGRELPANLVYRYNTVAALAERLATDRH